MKKFKLLFASMAVIAAMTGCASVKEAAEPLTSKLSALPSFDKKLDEIASANGLIEFPAIEKAKFSTNNYKGSWVNWDNVAQIEHQMSKDQVRHLIGSPHFSEGLWGVHEWNYLFNYRDANNEHQVCQFQVHFDDNMLVEAFYWSGKSCEEQAKPKSVVAPTIINNIVQQAPAAPAAELKETFELSADALFAFDKFAVSDIRVDGRVKLDSLVTAIKGYESKGRVGVYIIGHTDHLGDEAYNLDLSKKRADTVAGYLLSKGVKPVSLNSVGAGEYMPVKQCHSGTRSQLIDCLQPNRRVEVQIYTFTN